MEARNLFALVGRSDITVESTRELITVPPDIQRILRLYLRRHPEDAPGIEKVLRFRKRVREEFDRLMSESEKPTLAAAIEPETSYRAEDAES